MRLVAFIRRFPIAILFLCVTLQGHGGEFGSALTPGTRVLMDAHNCYPYDGRWSTESSVPSRPERLWRSSRICSGTRTKWIRFYTLDGLPDRDLRKHGWDKDYNFGSMERVSLRWKAAIDAGVDFLATDQYEDLAQLVRSRIKGTVMGVPIQ